jgi:hypothetical protein
LIAYQRLLQATISNNCLKRLLQAIATRFRQQLFNNGWMALSMKRLAIRTFELQTPEILCRPLHKALELNI